MCVDWAVEGDISDFGIVTGVAVNSCDCAETFVLYGGAAAERSAEDVDLALFG